MAHGTLPKTASENLLRQLVEIKEGKNKLFEEYFPEPSPERNEIEALLDNYITRLSHLLQETGKAKLGDRDVPFVTIGSEVTIEDLADQTVYKYRVVNPSHAAASEGDISYLSSVGKALLLKKVGDRIEVKAPGGTFRYQIKSIRLRVDPK
ncbi:MAG: GreA/GreB family elongation factor [bacterium]